MKLSSTQREWIQQQYQALEEVIHERQQQELAEPDRLDYQQFPTTVLFKNFNGDNLLTLGAKLGRVDEVMAQLQGSGEELSLLLHTALLYENFQLAEKLIESGVDLFAGDVNRTDYDSERAQEIFDRLARRKQQSVSESELVEKLVKKSNKTYVDLIAEIGELQLLPQELHSVFATWVNDGGKSERNRLLHRAAANGHIKELEFLLKLNVLVDSTNERAETALHCAVRAGHQKAVELLLKAGANINAEDVVGGTPLLRAVMNGNANLVRFLLEHGADPSKTTIFGETVFHRLRSGYEAVRAVLDKIPNRDEILSCMDIYERIAENKQVNGTNIAQSTIIDRMKYYLQLHYRNFEFFNEDGYCNGLSFLYQYYLHIKKAPAFFEILKAISKWDGNPAYLKQKPEPPLEEFTTYGELFESFLNEMTYFQMSPASEAVVNLQHSDRVGQLALVSDMVKIHAFGKEISGSLTQNEIQEILDIYARVPGLRIEVGGGGHATSLQMLQDRTAVYFDSNFTQEMKRPRTVSELTELLIKTKYQWSNKVERIRYQGFMVEGPLYPIVIKPFAFESVHGHDLQPNFEFFSQDELPKNMDDAIRYYEASPNKFSHLRIALMTQSHENIKAILSLPDSWKFLEEGTASSFQRSDIKNLFLDYVEQHPDLMDLVFMSMTKPEYNVVLCKLALFYKKIDVIQQWVEENKVDLEALIESSVIFCHHHDDNPQLVNPLIALYLKAQPKVRDEFILSMCDNPQTFKMILDNVPGLNPKIYDQIWDRIFTYIRSNDDAITEYTRLLIEHLPDKPSPQSLIQLLYCVNQSKFQDKDVLIKKIKDLLETQYEPQKVRQAKIRAISESVKAFDCTITEIFLNLLGTEVLNYQSSKHQNTLLHKALLMELEEDWWDQPRRKQLVSLLLQSGANLDLENDEGTTCRELIQNSNDQELIELMQIVDCKSVRPR